MTGNHDLMRDYRRATASIRFLEARRHMTDGPQALRDYRRVEAAIRFLEAHAGEQPALATVARAVGLSEFHFQRLFRRWAGVSPKRFLQYLTMQHAKAALREGSSILATSYEAGLSGPSRLHDLFIAVEAVTPGEYKEAGRNLEIHYGFRPSPFGPSFIATTPRGVCALEFVEGDDRAAAVARLARAWPAATIREDAGMAAHYVERIFSAGAAHNTPITLVLRGTNFQLKVWEALLRIPPGAATTYGEIAAAIGNPTAARAVGNAVGQNRIAYLIPCHRVLRGTGAFGGYRWGTERKQAMLGWEAVARNV